jgi:hypothetical protein
MFNTFNTKKMKRVLLLACLFLPLANQSSNASAKGMGLPSECSLRKDITNAIANAVIKECTEIFDYSYQEMLDMYYDAGTLRIEETATPGTFLVSLDGITVEVIIPI